jgi:hypothetical protein
MVLMINNTVNRLPRQKPTAEYMYILRPYYITPKPGMSAYSEPTPSITGPSPTANPALWGGTCPSIRLPPLHHSDNIYGQPLENALCRAPLRPMLERANTMWHITQDKCSDKKRLFFFGVREVGGWCVAYTSGVRTAVCTVGMEGYRWKLSTQTTGIWEPTPIGRTTTLHPLNNPYILNSNNFL